VPYALFGEFAILIQPEREMSASACTLVESDDCRLYPFKIFTSVLALSDAVNSYTQVFDV